MKNYYRLISFIFILFIFSNRINAQSGWYFQNPTSEGNVLKSCSFADNLHGVAVGTNGTILRTNSAGTDWKKITSPTTKDLFGVCFIDTKKVVAVGSNGTILKSNDGGDNWFVFSEKVYPDLLAVDFLILVLE